VFAAGRSSLVRHLPFSRVAFRDPLKLSTCSSFSLVRARCAVPERGDASGCTGKGENREYT
jgi:hypothetical protein